MTSPLVDPEPDRTRRNWLLRYIGVQEKYDHQIHTALLDASEYASSEIRKRVGDNRIGASTRTHQLQLARKTTRGIVKELFQDLKNIIRPGQSDAAQAATEAGLYVDRRVLKRLFPDPTQRANFEDSMRQSASRGVQAMMTRILVSNKPLSQQVYSTEVIANGYLDRIINTSLTAGDSAADLAKRVAGSIRPDTPGGVAYAAKRLGRTEINNAFHAQSIADVEDKPWVDYVTWNLSKVHVPQGCRCEEYAKQGRFQKENIPDKPHPLCMCYIAAVVAEWQEFKSNLLAGIYDGYIADHS